MEGCEVRLKVLERGHRLRARAFFAIAGRMAGGQQVDDVFKTILYRPALFGGPAWPGLDPVVAARSVGLVGRRA
jgi:hypothetical protein